MTTQWWWNNFTIFINNISQEQQQKYIIIICRSNYNTTMPICCFIWWSDNLEDQPTASSLYPLMPIKLCPSYCSLYHFKFQTLFGVDKYIRIIFPLIFKPHLSHTHTKFNSQLYIHTSKYLLTIIANTTCQVHTYIRECLRGDS